RATQIMCAANTSSTSLIAIKKRFPAAPNQLGSSHDKLVLNPKKSWATRANPKFEFRNPKQTNGKIQTRRKHSNAESNFGLLGHLAFDHLNLFRFSNLQLRIWSVGLSCVSRGFFC